MYATNATHTTELINCARCDGTHMALTFKPLTIPFEPEAGVKTLTYTHWAPCPTNHEPILMRFEATGPETVD